MKQNHVLIWNGVPELRELLQGLQSHYRVTMADDLGSELRNQNFDALLVEASTGTGALLPSDTTNGKRPAIVVIRNRGEQSAWCDRAHVIVDRPAAAASVIDAIARACSLRSLQTDNFAQRQRSTDLERAFRFGSVREMERLMIMNRLDELDQNRTRAAETLQISVRTLRNKLREYREAGLPVVSAAK